MATDPSEDITQDILDPLIEDYNSTKFTAGLNEKQNAYREDIIALFRDPEILKSADADQIVGQIIKQGNRVGGVDNIAARASRDVLRLKGQDLRDQGLDQVFNEYKLKVPPLTGINFQNYDSLDDEHEKVDGWAAQAKAAYNLKTKARHPELLAHRDEVFQKIDDTAKGLKRRVGATDNGFVDFVGRLAEGAAGFLDSANLDGTADFIRKHSATNPEWDEDTSSIIGQGLGQVALQLGAAAAAGVAVAATGGGALAAWGVGGSLFAATNLNATQQEREKKVVDATGSEGLAYAAATAGSAYGEAALDTIIDMSLAGMGKLGAGKAVKTLFGVGGRAEVAKGLAESVAATAGKTSRIRKAADLGGDILWGGTREGFTEAVQGAISDSSVGQYTNMRDHFDPFDVRNRAADALGGFAGGAGAISILAAKNALSPKDIEAQAAEIAFEDADPTNRFALYDRAKEGVSKAASAVNARYDLTGKADAAIAKGFDIAAGANAAFQDAKTSEVGTLIGQGVDAAADFASKATDRLLQAGAAFSKAPDAGTAANAATDFVNVAAANETEQILAGETVENPVAPTIEPAVQTSPAAVEPSPFTKLGNIYRGMKPVMGDLFSHPNVTAASEAMMHMLDKVSSYLPTNRPKDAAKPTVETAPVQEAAPVPEVAPVQEAAPVPEVAPVPDSVLSVAPDLRQDGDGYIGINQFSDTERKSLEENGLVQDVPSPTGGTYKAVDYLKLSDLRDDRRKELEEARKQAATDLGTIIKATQTDPVAKASEAIEDLNAPDDAPIASLEEGLTSFSYVPEKETLANGGSRVTFSQVNAYDLLKQRAGLAAAYGKGDLTEDTRDQTQIVRGSGESIGTDRNTYSVDYDADGNPTTFRTVGFGNAKGKKEPKRTEVPVRSKEEVLAKVQKILNTQKTTRQNGQLRQELDLKAGAPVRYSVPPAVKARLKDKPVTNLFKKIFRGKGGKPGVETFAEVNAYLDSREAFNDLVNSGLSEDEANPIITKLKRIHEPVFRVGKDGTPSKFARTRNDSLNALQLEIAQRVQSAQDLAEGVKQGYSEKIQSGVNKYLFGTPEPKASDLTAKEAKIVTAEPATEALSNNKELQLQAAQSFAGGNPEMLKKVLADPNFAAALQKNTETFLVDHDVNLDGTLEEARAQIDLSQARARNNVDAFKTQEVVPFNRAPFSIGRLLRKRGVSFEAVTAVKRDKKYQTLASTINPDGSNTIEQANENAVTTGRTYLSADGTPTIEVASATLRGPQAAKVLQHEVAETVFLDNKNPINDAVKHSGANAADIAAEARKVSDSIRINPVVDTTEHQVDAVSQYLLDNENLRKVSPSIANMLDQYIAENPDSPIAVLQKEISLEDAIDPSEKLTELQTSSNIAAELAREAVARSGNPYYGLTPGQALRAKTINRLKEIRRVVYDASADLSEMANALEKDNPNIANTFRKYLNVFKNRQQRALTVALTLKNAFDRKLSANGVTIDDTNEYLKNNKILNERSFWERQIEKGNISSTRLLEILNASPTAKKYMSPELLSRLIDRANSEQGENNLSATELINFLNDLSANAFAGGDIEKIQGEFKTNIINPYANDNTVEKPSEFDIKLRRDEQPNTDTLREAFVSAMSPLLAVTKTVENAEGVERVITLGFDLDNAARGNMENTGLVNRQVAQDALDNLKKRIGPDKYKMLTDYSNDVMARLVKLTIDELRDSGAISDKTAKFYLSNSNNYVTFQLSEALVGNPHVDAALRRSQGLGGETAGALETTMMKLAAVRSRAATQNFANAIQHLYYEYQGYSKTGKARPIAFTAEYGPKTNSWIQRNGYKAIDDVERERLAKRKAIGLEYMSIDAIKNYQAKMEEDPLNIGKSYVMGAENGNYVLHEIDDPAPRSVLKPRRIEKQGDLLKALSNVSAIARMFYTTNNPLFGVRSILKASSNLYKNRGEKEPSGEYWKDVLSAFFDGPIIQFPLDVKTGKLRLPWNSENLSLMYHAYQKAREFTKNIDDPDRILRSLGTTYNQSTGYTDLMSDPDVLFVLSRMGALPTSLTEDLSSGETAESSQQATWAGTKWFRNTKASELENFVGRHAKGSRIAGAAIEAAEPGRESSDSLKAEFTNKSNPFQRFLKATQDFNNSLELGEKFVGLLAYTKDGYSFDEALQKANMNYGNPDARGGGSAKAMISPFVMYSTSIFNGHRVVAETLREGIRNPRGDQRLMKSVVLGFRNRVMTSPLVIGTAVAAMASALGSSDDEAEKQGEIIKRLIQNIPESDRRTGTAFPIAFRDPRTRDWISPLSINSPDDIDPSWTTVYSMLPLDPSTSAVSGIFSGMFDAIDNGYGIAGIAASMMTSSMGQLAPGPSPLVTVGLGSQQMVRGVQPTNLFTGQSVVSDKDYQQGGAQLGVKYAQYLTNQVVPALPGPKASTYDKTKMLEPFGLGYLDILPAAAKFGIFKESNYGQVQDARNKKVLRDDPKVQVEADRPEDVTNHLNRVNELHRLARAKLEELKSNLMDAGESPKNAVSRASDLLPEDMKQELAAGQVWKRQVYGVLREKAEIALRSGDKKAYQEALTLMSASMPEP